MSDPQRRRLLLAAGALLAARFAAAAQHRDRPYRVGFLSPVALGAAKAIDRTLSPAMPLRADRVIA